MVTSGFSDVALWLRAWCAARLGIVEPKDVMIIAMVFLVVGLGGHDALAQSTGGGELFGDLTTLGEETRDGLYSIANIFTAIGAIVGALGIILTYRVNMRMLLPAIVGALVLALAPQALKFLSSQAGSF